MSVIGHQRPGIDRRLRIQGDCTHARDKIFTVLIVVNDHTLFNTPDNHMVQRPRSIQPRPSRHINPLTLSLLFISVFFLPTVNPEPVLFSHFIFICGFVPFVNNVPFYSLGSFIIKYKPEQAYIIDLDLSKTLKMDKIAFFFLPFHELLRQTAVL
jgi:hypothetical protein